MTTDLEVVLQRELDDAMAVLVQDRSEVIRVGDPEPAGRVADVVHRSAVPVRDAADPAQALRIEVQLDIAEVRVGEGLVEDVEEARAELQVLTLREVERLEQRDVRVVPARAAEVIRRLVRSVVPEARDEERVAVEEVLT